MPQKVNRTYEKDWKWDTLVFEIMSNLVSPMIWTPLLIIGKFWGGIQPHLHFIGFHKICSPQHDLSIFRHVHCFVRKAVLSSYKGKYSFVIFTTRMIICMIWLIIKHHFCHLYFLVHTLPKKRLHTSQVGPTLWHQPRQLQKGDGQNHEEKMTKNGTAGFLPIWRSYFSKGLKPPTSSL